MGWDGERAWRRSRCTRGLADASGAGEVYKAAHEVGVVLGAGQQPQGQPESGVTSLVILNGHRGNYVLGNVVQEGNAHGKRMALFPSESDWAEARQSAQLVSSGHEDIHAGEIETSILLHPPRTGQGRLPR